MSIQDTEIPSKIECPYCSTVFDENEEQCPKCGAFPSVDQKLPELSVWQYLQALLPSELPHSQDREDNAIKQRVILIQGSQESGKSNTAKVIVQGLRGHYKAKEVSVQWVQGENFKEILDGKWTHKPIQCIVIEDITDCKISELAARNFFRVRHVMSKKTGRKEGLCVLIFTLHGSTTCPSHSAETTTVSSFNGSQWVSRISNSWRKTLDLKESRFSKRLKQKTRKEWQWLRFEGISEQSSDFQEQPDSDD